MLLALLAGTAAAVSLFFTIQKVFDGNAASFIHVNYVSVVSCDDRVWLVGERKNFGTGSGHGTKLWITEHLGGAAYASEEEIAQNRLEGIIDTSYLASTACVSNTNAVSVQSHHFVSGEDEVEEILVKRLDRSVLQRTPVGPQAVGDHKHHVLIHDPFRSEMLSVQTLSENAEDVIYGERTALMSPISWPAPLPRLVSPNGNQQDHGNPATRTDGRAIAFHTANGIRVKFESLVGAAWTIVGTRDLVPNAQNDWPDLAQRGGTFFLTYDATTANQVRFNSCSGTLSACATNVPSAWGTDTLVASDAAHPQIAVDGDGRVFIFYDGDPVSTNPNPDTSANQVKLAVRCVGQPTFTIHDVDDGTAATIATNRAEPWAALDLVETGTEADPDGFVHLGYVRGKIDRGDLGMSDRDGFHAFASIDDLCPGAL